MNATTTNHFGIGQNPSATRKARIALSLLLCALLAASSSALGDPIYISGVPDWDQPVLAIPGLPGGPVGPWGAWCVPTAAANIAGYYEDVWGVVGTGPNYPYLGDQLAFPTTTVPGSPPWQDFTAFTGPGPFNPFRTDFGWYFNTNDVGNRAGGNPTFPGRWTGTHLTDIEFGTTGLHGLVGPDGFFPFRGITSATVRNYGSSTLDTNVYNGFDNTGDPQGVHTDANAFAEIDGQVSYDVPLLAHFAHFNLINRRQVLDIPGPTPDFFPDSDAYDVAEWGDQMPGDPESGEIWLPEEGLGHTVTIVGFWDAADPRNPFYRSGLNAVVVHDNTDGYLPGGQPLPLVLPWDGSPWMGLTQINGLIPCPGDLNGDRTVDLTDLGTLLADFGCTGGNCIADIDGDGDTDLADLGILLANFGLICP